MPATPAQLRIIRRYAIAGIVAGSLYAIIAIVTAFTKSSVTGVVLVLSLPVYVFLPVGAGAIAGCLLGWAVCLTLGKK